LTGITQPPTDHPRIGTNPTSPMNRQCVTCRIIKGVPIIKIYYLRRYIPPQSSDSISGSVFFNMSTKKVVKTILLCIFWRVVNRI